MTALAIPCCRRFPGLAGAAAPAAVVVGAGTAMAATTEGAARGRGQDTAARLVALVSAVPVIGIQSPLPQPTRPAAFASPTQRASCRSRVAAPRCWLQPSPRPWRSPLLPTRSHPRPMVQPAAAGRLSAVRVAVPLLPARRVAQAASAVARHVTVDSVGARSGRSLRVCSFCRHHPGFGAVGTRPKQVPR